MFNRIWPVFSTPVCAALIVLNSTGASADDAGLAQELTNPVAALISVPIQYNFDENGDGLHGYNIVKNEKGTIVFDKHIEAKR